MTIIFDLDGTIADIWPLERATLLCMAKSDDADFLNALYRQGNRNLLELFQIISNQSIAHEKFDRQYQTAQKEMVANQTIPSFPIFLEEAMLRGLYNTSFGLLTGSMRTEALLVLERSGCLHYFSDSLILCRGEYAGEKSDGQPFLELKKRTGAPFVMIGDSVADEAGAACAGLPCIRVSKQADATQQGLSLAEAICQASQLLLQLESLGGVMAKRTG